VTTLLLLAWLAQAPLSSGQPFSIASAHAGANTTTFRLVIDGATVSTKPVSAILANDITFALPTGLPSGTYDIRVDAVGPLGVTPSPALSLVVAVAPQTGCTGTTPLTVNITTWQPAYALRDTRGMEVSWTIAGPSRVVRTQVDLVDDQTPGWETLYLSTGLDGRDYGGMRIFPKVIGTWSLVMVVEDERGCIVQAAGTRTVQVVQ
jgi:hypothetical protein